MVAEIVDLDDSGYVDFQAAKCGEVGRLGAEAACLFIWRFSKIGGTPKWLVCNGTSH